VGDETGETLAERGAARYLWAYTTRSRA